MDTTQVETGNSKDFEHAKAAAKKRVNVTYMVELAALTAIIILMAAVPALGYIPIGTLQITLLVVPVSVGAVLLGPKAGAFLGFVFGVTSLLQGSALFMMIPVRLTIVCIVPRVLVGIVSGWTYIGMKKLTKKVTVSTAAACVAAPLSNTILYLSAYILLLGTFMAGYNPEVFGFLASSGFAAAFAIFLASVSVNVVCEVAAGLIIGTAICNALRFTVNKRNR